MWFGAFLPIVMSACAVTVVVLLNGPESFERVSGSKVLVVSNW